MTRKIDIIDEVQQNFIDSSYDVNTNRAFPSVKDGLKPGQRACIWEMYSKKYFSNKPHVKSAKIDGGVAALWWPHGTTAIYETFARMSQPFTNNIPEIDFHGANGNIILGGDSIAADRYTEARLAKITEEGMLKGIDKNNVPMQKNYSEDEDWPVVLPAVFPRLLVNGAQGIGVSLANVWLPHNFGETADLILHYLATNELLEDSYYPDFPTGGTIVNEEDLSVINKTGKGKAIVEAKYKIVGQEIIFYEMPYQVYIEPVIEKIKALVDAEELDGLVSVLNKSDRKQIALVVECQKGVSPKDMVGLLFALTPLRSQYNANQNGIISKTPILLNLKETVDVYASHNLCTISNEFKYDFGKITTRIEILEGLTKALLSIDEIIKIIRESDSSQSAKSTLMNKFNFTELQAKSILDMRLARLTKLDSVEIETELQKKQEDLAYYQEVINSKEKQKSILIERLTELKEKYSTPRRTEITQKIITKYGNGQKTKKVETIPEDIVVTFNKQGYLQAISIKEYRDGSNSNILTSFKTTTTDIILLFSNKGKYFRINGKDIGLCGMKDKGTAAGSIIKLDNGEKIIGVFSTNLQENKEYLFFGVSNGLVKKVEKAEYFGTTRNLNGIKAINLQEKNEVLIIQETNNNDTVVLYTKQKYAIRFCLKELNSVGKTASGVKGISLTDGDYIQGILLAGQDNVIKLNNKDFKIPIQKRGGKGKQYGIEK